MITEKCPAKKWNSGVKTNKLHFSSRKNKIFCFLLFNFKKIIALIRFYNPELII
jgi:hypothetical protein